ncbi:CD1108 family mobile element protein [Eubacterium callanderi]|uniref:CD1108 family mobile element protein n=1 Tax=Eubacterium callanderi TaxID=53442 RepID=UPI001FB6B8C8|nr:DNA topoisomerase [Eubacterium callanderi]
MQKKLIIAVVVLIVVLMLSGSAGLAGGMLGSFSDTTIATSYTADDSDILAVEQNYKNKESDLQTQVNNIPTTYPGYDEYRYNLAEINHNPYQLAALLTVLYEDYTESEVQAKLTEIFNAQYKLTTREVTEKRTRTETRTGHYKDEKGKVHSYTYTVEVEYDWRVLVTTLTNNTMDSVVRNMGLTEDQMSRYELLLETRGNKSYLFEGDPYSNPDPGEYQNYDIPPEALTDTRFANMIREAEKYLGYPYVWGGSSPSTSFDCSGFVSYVINHCGNGWNYGRQTADGLLNNCCTRISRDEAKPGDLIFFQGTYETSGAGHVGIYVGNGMMIHCGNPIQYANKYYGFTAQQTLDYTQSLYEKKLVTYPRTDSRYLTDDMEDSAATLCGLMKNKYGYTKMVPIHAKQVTNSAKVSDHHAIIPTENVADADYSEIPSGEQKILGLVTARLLASVGDSAEITEYALEVECAGNTFKAKSKCLTKPGWHLLEDWILGKKTDENEEDSDKKDDGGSHSVLEIFEADASLLEEGRELPARDPKVKEGKTTPKKRFTEDSLLSAMESAGAKEMPDEVERKGLGTPATRAGVIEKLVRIGFVERQGNKKTKYLVPTEKGKEYGKEYFESMEGK